MLSGLVKAVDALTGTDVCALGADGRRERIASLVRQRARLDAELARTVAAADAAGDADGLTTASWVAWSTRLPKAAAKGLLANGRAMRSMPATSDAFSAGDLSADHVRVLAAAWRANPSAFDELEDELVDDGKTLRFDAFHRRVQYARQVTDPDGVEADAQDALDRRHLNASRSFENTVRIDGWLDAIGGTVFLNELQRLEGKLFDADWAAAREHAGDHATVADLMRTPGQRRADALRLMAERSSGADGTTPARPLITVHVGYETVAGRLCQLADGAVITPGQILPLLTDADVERIVFDGPRRVVDVGRKRRCFDGAGRRAVQARDLECQGHPACDVPYEHCEVDHVRQWEHGGPTDHDNGRLLCPRCHRHHHSERRRPPPGAG